jgi:hypothetical protein
MASAAKRLTAEDDPALHEPFDADPHLIAVGGNGFPVVAPLSAQWI